MNTIFLVRLGFIWIMILFQFSAFIELGIIGVLFLPLTLIFIHVINKYFI